MTTHLERLLCGLIEPGVYSYRSRASIASIAWRARITGWRFFHLDGQRIESKADLLAACAEAMRFPVTFGRNWDALEDSLRDLSWAPAHRGYLLLYDGAGRLAAAAPEDFAVAVDVFRSAAAHWRQSETPLAVLLRGLKGPVPGLAEL